MWIRADQRTELQLVETNPSVVGDIQRRVAFYRDVLGTTLLEKGETGSHVIKCREAQ